MPRMPMNCLIIGYGSIGKRHKRLLEVMGHDVSVVTRRPRAVDGGYGTVRLAFDAAKFDYVVVANQTHEHHDALCALADVDYQGRVLVEKPLFDRVRPLPDLPLGQVFVAANLRFHPVIRRLPSLIEGRRILTIQIYVGQYLPDWRPDVDYRQCYSAFRAAGGGVLRDLSHELDYLTWLTGAWRRLTAVGGKLSSLEIDSDDAFSLLVETERCPIAGVSLNYLDRKLRREIIINMEGRTVKGDLIANTLEVNGKIEALDGRLDDTYLDQHRALLKGHVDNLCTCAHALDVLGMIEGAEKASRQKIWVSR